MHIGIPTFVKLILWHIKHKKTFRDFTKLNDWTK